MRDRRAALSVEQRLREAEAVAEAFVVWIRSSRPWLTTRREEAGSAPGEPLRALSFVGVRGELDTAPLHRALLDAGARLWLPRIEGPGVLACYEVRDLHALCHGPHGLREPAPEGERLTRASLSSLDLVLTPGVAFGRDGARLGQGGGYYDRLLGDAAGGARPVCVGVGFASQLVDAGMIPMDPHDVPLDGVLTSAGVCATSPRLHPRSQG